MMTCFIEVSNPDNSKVMINSKHITVITPIERGGCKIWFTDDGNMVVKESYPEMLGLVNCRMIPTKS